MPVDCNNPRPLRISGMAQEARNRNSPDSQEAAESEVPLVRKRHVKLILAVVQLIAVSSTLAAQEGESTGLRFDLSSFLGYRTSMSFPIEPQVTNIGPRVVVEASPSYGFSFGARPREEDLIEVRWARQDTYVRAEQLAFRPPTQRVLVDQFHGDFSHEPFIENWPWWAKPFVLASVGATHVSSEKNFNFTRFSFGIGTGIRLYLNRRFGFKFQAEWLPVVVNPEVAFVCGAGCIIRVRAIVASQGEAFVGPIFRF